MNSLVKTLFVAIAIVGVNGAAQSETISLTPTIPAELRELALHRGEIIRCCFVPCWPHQHHRRNVPEHARKQMQQMRKVLRKLFR